jgi:hypothetical protein
MTTTTTTTDLNIADRLAAKIAMLTLADLRESVRLNPGNTIGETAIALAAMPQALSFMRAHWPGTAPHYRESHILTAAAGLPLLRAVAQSKSVALDEVEEAMIFDYLQKSIFEYLPFDDAPIAAA